MKKIYEDIISEGTTGVADECGENKKGENLALVAQIEMESQLKLFPEMLEMLITITHRLPLKSEFYENSEIKDRAFKLISKAEGCK